MRKASVVAAAVLGVLPLSVSSAQVGAGSQDALARGFVTPPDSAKPRTWWHWTNGNVSEAGITKDLEWMKRAGIGGFQLVDVSAGGGQTVEPKIHFATPEWYSAVKHSADLAKQLDLEMSIFSCAGWSEAGGPWVKPEMAMKHLVYSETTVEGGKTFSGQLPSPIPKRDVAPVAGDNNITTGPDDLSFYRDSAVIAYKVPADEVSMESLNPKVTSSAGEVQNAKNLFDNSPSTSVRIPLRQGGPAWLQYEFAQPFTARALGFGSPGHIPVGRILVSDDGATFRTIVSMPGPQGYHGASMRTFAFPAVTGRFFRIEFDRAALSPAEVIHGAAAEPEPPRQRPGAPRIEPGYSVSEAIFYSDAHVNRWEDKGAFGSLMDVYDVVPTPAAPGSAEIASADVINLTGKMDASGTLHWDAPAGRWRVIRMGYGLTGARNRPSVPAGSGLEVDKLSSRYVKQYFDGYVDPLKQHLGDLVGPTVHYMTMDSWEAGMQNWTDDMIAQFQKRRGYDPTPWLPVLAGHVVESADASDRFLWDFRRTLADMYASEFYGTMDDELHKIGMQAYSEASGVALEIPEDTLLNKSHIDIPMAEFWVRALHPESMYYVDVRGAASASHVYGKPLVATESFTGGGYESPYTLKKIADYWFAQGVNRLVFHTSAEQPLDTKPGNTMVGTHINRNITWAEMAKPFMTYVARVSYMLQQGSPNADIAYLLPEGAPSTMPFWGQGLNPALPQGYDYDFVNTDVLLHRTSVTDDGRIHVEGSKEMPEGMTYRLLVLPPTMQMTPEVMHKLKELVAAGATISGPRPVSSPSLMGGAGADEDLRSAALDAWGDADSVTLNQHRLGKGMVYSGLSLAEVLTRLKTSPDFASSGSIQEPAAWIHRHTADADIYFVANQADAPTHMEARFRVTGKAPEVWRPMDGDIVTDGVAYSSAAKLDMRTGNREPGLQPAMYAEDKGFTVVPLDLAERESVFVVFRHTAADASRAATAAPSEKSVTVEGPWNVGFGSGPGAPAKTQFPALASWTSNADAGVKYFSGTATYSKTMQAPVAWFVQGKAKAGAHVWLDLGTVRDIAEVKVNGKSVGTVWAPPYRVDVTSALRPGQNSIEIAVTNEWTNRIVGDRVDPEHKVLNVSQAANGFGPPLMTPPDSGLLGPVRLEAVSAPGR